MVKKSRMSINLQQLAKIALDQDLVRRASEHFGITNSQTQAAFDALVPSLIARMLDMACTTQGARTLHAAIMSPAVDTNVGPHMVSRLDALNNIVDSMSRGHENAKLLLGERLDPLARAVSEQSKVPVHAMPGLIGIVTGVLFGLLKNHLQDHNGQRHQLVSALEHQASAVQVGEHAGYWPALGLGTAAAFFGSVGGRLKTVMTAFRPDPAPAAAQGTAQSAHKGPGAWWWLLTLALALAVLLLLLRNARSDAKSDGAAFPAAATAPASVAAAPAASNTVPLSPKEPVLSLTTDSDGKPSVQATVATDEQKQAILNAIEQTYGQPLQADIKVDPQARPAQWVSKLGALLPNFKLPNAELSIKGDDIQIGGAAADAKWGLADKARAALGDGFKISLFSLSEALQNAKKLFGEGLTALKPGACSSGEVVKVMNTYTINFATGTFTLPKDDLDALARAAKAVKGCAGSSTRLEIAGHTDSVGAEQANLDLSTHRAEVVREYLISQGLDAGKLLAKGYGASRPVGDNDTPRGRFMNRRIEFIEQK